MQINQFIQQLWFDYLHVTPQAQVISKAFEMAGESLINDHVAIRTFDLAPMDIAMLEQHILNMGYTHFAPYEYDASHLKAWSYLPPEEGLPKIFFSELITEQLSYKSQQIIHRLVGEIPLEVIKRPQVFWAGRLWSMPTWQEYQLLLEESEYAAWLSVMGLRANHFSMSVNHLKQTPEMDQVLNKVEALGFSLNTEGGRIKGSRLDLLEQGSTLPDQMLMHFADGSEHSVTTCYYEFARRYPDYPGHLYDGFMPMNINNLSALHHPTIHHHTRGD